jgi:hypothetical protein
MRAFMKKWVPADCPKNGPEFNFLGVSNKNQNLARVAFTFKTVGSKIFLLDIILTASRNFT